MRTEQEAYLLPRLLMTRFWNFRSLSSEIAVEMRRLRSKIRPRDLPRGAQPFRQATGYLNGGALRRFQALG